VKVCTSGESCTLLLLCCCRDPVGTIGAHGLTVSELCFLFKIFAPTRSDITLQGRRVKWVWCGDGKSLRVGGDDQKFGQS
jgi:hypothetical protein